MGFQQGRGYPLYQPKRSVPTKDQSLLSYDTGPGGNGGLILQTPFGQYARKYVRELVIDISTAFTDRLYNIEGSLVWWSDASASNLGQLYFRPDEMGNGRIPLIYDRGVSGVPFSRFYLTAPTAFASTTITLTIIQDAVNDRVGING